VKNEGRGETASGKNLQKNKKDWRARQPIAQIRVQDWGRTPAAVAKKITKKKGGLVRRRGEKSSRTQLIHLMIGLNGPCCKKIPAGGRVTGPVSNDSRENSTKEPRNDRSA